MNTQTFNDIKLDEHDKAIASKRVTLYNEIDGPRIESDRNATIKAIKSALQRRSGKAWSVTGGRGTAWGWIHITAPPARKTFGHREREDVDRLATWRERVEEYDTGETGHSMSFADIDELALLLDLPASQCDGVGVPASYEYRREYLARAEGKTPAVIAQPTPRNSRGPIGTNAQWAYAPMFTDVLNTLPKAKAFNYAS